MEAPEKTTGPLDVLQLQRIDSRDGRFLSEQEIKYWRERLEDVRLAAVDICFPLGSTFDEVAALCALSRALAEYLVAIVRNAPPSHERSTAIARAREARFWASAAIAMQRLQRPAV